MGVWWSGTLLIPIGFLYSVRDILSVAFELKTLTQDTAGEEKYASLSAFYCRGASVAVLAFDLTSSTSFNKLRDIFIPLLQDSVDNCLTVVVGTKADLLDSKEREVRSSEGRALAVQQHRFQLERALQHNPNTFLKDLDGSKLYYETSSKTGSGVDKLFEDIQCILLAELEKTGNNPRKNSQSKVVELHKKDITDEAAAAGPKAGCC